MIGLTGGSTDLWGTAHVKSVQLTVVPLTFCTLRIECLTVDSGSFRIENDEECPFYQFIYYDFHIWPHWYVLFIQWSCFFWQNIGLDCNHHPFLAIMLPNLLPSHFQPFSCDTGEMLEAKLRQQLQAHMWDLGFVAIWIKWLISVDPLQA